jgi:hypothetical protein
VTANIPVRNGHVWAVLWHRRIGQVVGHVGWWQGRLILGVPGPTCTGTLHLLGGSNFDPPGLTHCWYSLSLPKWSAGEMRQHGLLMRQVKWSLNKSRGACTRSEMMGRWWSCTTWELGAARDVSVRDAGGGSSGLSI